MKSLIQLLLLTAIISTSCDAKDGTVSMNELSLVEESKIRETWINSVAEISSFSLRQGHYGKSYEGEAVMIFVHEPFLPVKQVKDETNSLRGIDVLKLNFKKFFTTGIYPYSSMTSVFTPLAPKELGNTLKVNNTTQDWCGQSFSQVNRQGDLLTVKEFSYFEKKGDQTYRLRRIVMEDELWNLIRLNPQKLPLGEFGLLPSLMRQRLSHLPVKEIKVRADMQESVFEKEKVISYKLSMLEGLPYKNIYFSPKFPYYILGWEEFLPNGQKTQAYLRKRIQSAYWEKNHPRDEKLRKQLQIEGG